MLNAFSNNYYHALAVIGFNYPQFPHLANLDVINLDEENIPEEREIINKRIEKSVVF